jgi:orotate phosphoribosyltransferase-like protein
MGLFTMNFAKMNTKFYVAVADVAGRGVDTGAVDAMTAEGSSTLRGFLMRFHSPVL